MRAYLSTWRIRALCELQYRGAAIAGMSTQLFFGFIIVMRYMALYESGTDDGATIPLAQTITYVWLQQMMLRMYSNGGDNQIVQAILNGNIAVDLCRPLDFYTYWLSRSLAARFVGLAMRALLLLAIVVWLPQPYGMLPPASGAYFGLAILSFLLGICIACMIDALMYALTMRTLDNRGPSTIFTAITWFCGGVIVPLPLYPQVMQDIMQLLPFTQTANAPIRLYLGLTPMPDVPMLFAVQIFWLIALLVLGKCLWHRAVRRMALQGG